jgi:hypothetical protein
LLQEDLEHIRSQVVVRDEMRQSLLEKISAGRLLAWGFPIENGVASDQPQEIPPPLYADKFIDWEKSSVKGLGREFVSVRVVLAARIESKTTPPKSPPISAQPPNRPGRPTKSDQIWEACDFLALTGLNLAELSVKELSDHVRKRIDQRWHTSGQRDPKGLSDASIQRHYRNWVKRKV